MHAADNSLDTEGVDRAAGSRLLRDTERHSDDERVATFVVPNGICPNSPILSYSFPTHGPVLFITAVKPLSGKAFRTTHSTYVL